MTAAVVAALVGALPAALALTGPTGKTKKKPVPPTVHTGVIGGGCVASAAGDTCSAVASFVPKSRHRLEQADFGVLGGLVEHPECPGSVGRPAGTPGLVCVYPIADEALNIGVNGEGAFAVEANPLTNGVRGFRLRWTAAAAGPSAFYAIWTYVDRKGKG
jgi:hypothetical protein